MSTITTSTTNRTRKPATPPAPLNTASNTAPQTTATPRSTAHVLTHAQVAQRAYEIYRSRNNGPGDQLSDWLQAERELRAGFHPTLS